MTMNDMTRFLHGTRNLSVRRERLAGMIAEARMALEDNDRLGMPPAFRRLAEFVIGLDPDVPDDELQADCAKRIGLLLAPAEPMGNGTFRLFLVEAATMEEAKRVLKRWHATLGGNGDILDDYIDAFKPTIRILRQNDKWDMSWINVRLNGEPFEARYVPFEDNPFLR